jgi:Protein of unknown function (DUF3072)
MSPSRNDPSPTPAQLRYLRTLAQQTGTTFSLPRTRAQASSEIERLKQLKARRGRHTESPPEADPGEQPYATAVHPSEVSGFGSQASWQASPPLVRVAVQGSVGKLTELARYEVNGAERVLYGQRIAGCVRITDRPASGAGRSYLVERECEQDGYSALQALVADYIEQSRELDEVPMASSVIASQLEHGGPHA